MRAMAAAALDALAPGHPGRWEDERVVVCHADRAAVPVRLVSAREPDATTAHFELYRTGRRLLVLHRLRPDELDDDLAGLLAEELARPGLLAGPSDFERVFTGVVRSTISDPVTAWAVFYANTMAALRGGARPGGSIAGYAPVHRHAGDLLAGRDVLDLGCCFGFLPLRMVDEGYRLVATDACAGTVRLLATVAAHSGRPLWTLACDAARVPLADGCIDTVTAVHLLEHLPPAHGAAVLAEALRLARRRVVVAVPYEPEPDPAYGHLRAFDAAALHALGASTGRSYAVHEHHGGWLVVDAG